MPSCIDDGDLEGVAELFRRAEIVSTVHNVRRTGFDEVLQMYRRSCRLYEATGTPLTKHLTTNVIIELDENGMQASARSYYTVIQATDSLPLQAIISGQVQGSFSQGRLAVGVRAQGNDCRFDWRLLGPSALRCQWAHSDSSDARGALDQMKRCDSPVSLYHANYSYTYSNLFHYTEKPYTSATDRSWQSISISTLRRRIVVTPFATSAPAMPRRIRVTCRWQPSIRPCIAPLSSRTPSDTTQCLTSKLRPSICGLGEPLINPNTPEFIRKIRAAGFSSCGMSSNGALLDERRGNAILEAGVTSVNINISDLGEEYERIYNLPYEETRDNIVRFIKNSGADCEVQIVLVNHRRGSRSTLRAWKISGVATASLTS